MRTPGRPVGPMGAALLLVAAVTGGLLAVHGWSTRHSGPPLGALGAAGPSSPGVAIRLASPDQPDRLGQPEQRPHQSLGGCRAAAGLAELRVVLLPGLARRPQRRGEERDDGAVDLGPPNRLRHLGDGRGERPPRVSPYVCHRCPGVRRGGLDGRRGGQLGLQPRRRRCRGHRCPRTDRAMTSQRTGDRARPSARGVTDPRQPPAPWGPGEWAGQVAADWAPTAGRVLLGLVLAWFGYHELVQPSLWTGYVPVVSGSTLLVLLVLAHGWLLVMLAVALLAGIAVRAVAAVAVLLLLADRDLADAVERAVGSRPARRGRAGVCRVPDGDHPAATRPDPVVRGPRVCSGLDRGGPGWCVLGRRWQADGCGGGRPDPGPDEDLRVG